MDRRNFICQVGGVGAASLSVTAAAAAKEDQSVIYKVNGFTCITCAVGLEVMLRGTSGVTRANASYPERKVAIGFDSHMTSEKQLREFIASCGFSVSN
jgi:Cu+-exporting ATPase